MREILKQRAWARHLTVAILYFIGYLALRQVSFAFWLLPAGVRLFCLLITPYRYWPALAVGEMLSVGEQTYTCYKEFGPVYASLRLLPASVIAMPIVHWFRKHMPVMLGKRQVQINAFVFCTFVVSIVLAGYNYFRYWISPLPVGAQHITLEWLPRYFLGQYLGVLTVTPLALLIWQQIKSHDWKLSLSKIGHSRLAVESMTILLPSIALLMLIAIHAKGDESMAARIAMFLPVAALTMRHGWKGATIGGTVASVAIAMAMPVLYDAETMQAEVFMAFTITVLITLGARIEALDRKEETAGYDGLLAIESTRQLVYMGELRIQAASDRLQQVSTAINHAQLRLLDRVRHFMSEAEARSYGKTEAPAQLQDTSILYHRAWRSNGLAATLSHGSIARALQSIGIIYSCEFKAVELDAASPGFQLAIYRVACEGVAYIHERTEPSRLKLRLRAGICDEQAWAVLQITGDLQREAGFDIEGATQDYQHVRKQLGAVAQGLEGIRSQIRIYGGLARARSAGDTTRLSLVMHDGAGPTGQTH